VATLPYIPEDSLALSFGGSRSFKAITLEQVRRFVDTAGLPMKPVSDVMRETADRTRDEWLKLAEKDLLPAQMAGAIDMQIKSVVLE
jgi:serine/threonine-protein kinase HipA